jgi:two-component system, cell cycle sensor histidine kinase and response regulator CckA
MDDQATILAVDDNPESLASLARTLTTAGYLVRPADSGEEALAAAAASRPDLILLDVWMKGMSGLEVCRRLRAADALRGVPVILISAFAETSEWVAGLQAGASDCITKPFQIEELLFRIRMHVSLGRVMASVKRQAAALEQANTRLHVELVERERVGESLRRILERAERSRRAMLSILEDKSRTDAALREEARLLSESQRLGHVGSWLFDLDGSVAWSAETYQIYGVSPDTFVPTRESLFTLLHPDDRAGMHKWISACLEGEKPAEWEFRVVLPDGTVRHAMGRGDAVRDSNGRISHIAGTVQDITERKSAEAHRAKLESDLRQVQKMESVGRLAGGVAHDFNNMLGVILGHVELALRQVSPDTSLHSELTEIHKAALRSADLTRQLLAFARKQVVAPRVLSLNPTVDGALSMLRWLIGENIDVRWLPRTDLWPVRVDPAQVDQILTNLCANARDAIAGVGTITIETDNATLDQGYCEIHPGAVAGDYASLSVSDDGCGMDQVQLTLVFEPFFTTKEPGRGTGLGLATVYGIVKQNSGFVNVYSEPNHGTTIRVYLPRYMGQAVPVSNEGKAGPVPVPVPGGQETILLVEDEPALLKLTRRMLEGEGYTVLAADTPGTAVGLAREHAGHVSLLLTDMIMPEMNGRVLADRLRSDDPSLKVLFMSGYTADVIARHGVLHDGVNYLEKPFSAERLAAGVRAALDTPA